MAKTKTTFFCGECGHESSGWLGRCPGCGAWNTFTESTKVTQSGSKNRHSTWADTGDQMQSSVMTLADVHVGSGHRFSSGLPELDRVLGGGYVPGALVLIGGDPGIGKSTLLLQSIGHCR